MGTGAGTPGSGHSEKGRNMTATQLEQTIRHDGYAQVIAILHRGAAAAAGAEHAPDF